MIPNKLNPRGKPYFVILFDSNNLQHIGMFEYFSDSIEDDIKYILRSKKSAYKNVRVGIWDEDEFPKRLKPLEKFIKTSIKKSRYFLNLLVDSDNESKFKID